MTHLNHGRLLKIPYFLACVFFSFQSVCHNVVNMFILIPKLYQITLCSKLLVTSITIWIKYKCLLGHTISSFAYFSNFLFLSISTLLITPISTYTGYLILHFIELYLALESLHLPFNFPKISCFQCQFSLEAFLDFSV